MTWAMRDVISQSLVTTLSCRHRSEDRLQLLSDHWPKVSFLDHLLRPDACRDEVAPEGIVENHAHIATGGHPPPGTVGLEEWRFSLISQQQCRADRCSLDGGEGGLFEMPWGYGEQARAAIRGEPVRSEDGT